MRSLVLVILSALGLAGLFIVYWMMQPTHVGSSVADVSKMPVPPPPKGIGSGVFRPGEIVWLKQYDRNGQLLSRFSGDEYVPQRDGTIHVTHPVAEFFLANHQRLVVHGDDGNVVAKDVPRMAENAFSNAGPPAPPSRGRLNHVQIVLIDDAKSATVLTMTTDNVVFDNETYRISTEGYKDAQDKKIADDDVPVHISGQIQMEGRGLTVRWNDKDGRLELLEIAHGEVLTIADPSNFSIGGGAKDPKGKAAARGDSPPPQMLATTRKDDAAQVVTHFPGAATTPQQAGDTTTPHMSTAPVVYQASFYDNVRINQPQPDGQGDQILIDNVNRMDVDFLLKQSGENPTTKPAGTTQPGPPTPQAASRAAPATLPASQPSGVATIQPATQPAMAKEQPVYIHWTGVLRITPLKTSSPPVPLKPGDSAILLVGAPVSIHRVDPRQQGTDDVHCGSVLYQTAGENVWLGKSEQFPQILVVKFPATSAKEKLPTQLTSTGSVQYSRAEGKAILTGPGHAEVPIEGDQKDNHPLLHAAWAKLAEFDFTQPEGEKQPAVHLGHLEGDVDIRHPRFVLRSQMLDLLFDSPTKSLGTRVVAPTATETRSSQPNLRQAIASTGVFCQMDSENNKKQMIECNRLVLDTDKSADKFYARHVNATGSVHAYGEDDLRAEYVDLLLKPAGKVLGASTKPSTGDPATQVELETMVARDHVVATSKEGSIATGDELKVSTEDGKQKTVLTSQTQASVTDAKRNVVKGPEIQFDSEDGRAHVVGAGSLHAIQQASATQPAQNVDVTWANDAIFDGAANHVDVNGSVLATSIDKRGYVDTAKGEHIRINLRPKPATQPADARPIEAKETQTGSPVKPTVSAGGLKMDPFKGKEVSAMTIESDASLTSTLSATNGDILQQFELAGPTIIVNEFAADGSPSRSITVPAAGKMLTRDHRPVTKQAQAGENESSGARGATAFQWSRKLVYIEATHRADMVGDVVVVHQDDDANPLPVKMNCEHVIAWFEAAPKPAAGTPTARKPGDDQPAMQLRYLTAEGSEVVIVRDVDQVIARQVDYDPKRHLLIATGTERNPVNFSNGPTSGGTAEEVDWDTLTWKMKAKNAVFDYRPPTPPVPSPEKKKPPTTNRSK